MVRDSERGNFCINVQHALNRGEKQLGHCFVDNYVEINGVKFTWEFLGCFYHRCLFCFRPSDTCSLTGTIFEQVNAVCEEKILRLQCEQGDKVIVMRERTWVEMKKSHPGLKEFLQGYNPPQPLSPRVALYDSRTCAARHTASPN